MQATEELKVERRLERDTKDSVDFIGKYPLSIVCSLALYFNSAGTPDKGLSLLISAVDKYPEEWTLYDKLVLLAHKAGKAGQAEEKLQEAQILFPDNPCVWASSGRHCFLQKDFSRSIHFLEKTVRLNPEDGINYLFLASSRLALLAKDQAKSNSDSPDSKQAEKELQRFRELSPRGATEDFLTAEELLSRKNYPEALRCLERCVNGYLNQELEFSKFHQLFFSFYLEPEKFDLEELKRLILDLEKKLNLSSSPVKEFNHLGCSYLLFFINLIKSSDEQLKKALILDPEFRGAQEASGSMEKILEEMLPLIDSLKF